jgi:hypothetical protein
MRSSKRRYLTRSFFELPFSLTPPSVRALKR